MGVQWGSTGANGLSVFYCWVCFTGWAGSSLLYSSWTSSIGDIKIPAEVCSLLDRLWSWWQGSLYTVSMTMNDIKKTPRFQLKVEVVVMVGAEV